jgi:hypothetical protein
VNTNHRNEKPIQWGPYELFRASYHSLFARIRTETNPAERERLIKEVKKKAKRANISLPRREFDR